MKDKDQYGHARPGFPPSGSEGKQPGNNGPQCPFDSVSHVLGVRHPVQLPTQASDVPDHTEDQADEENEK